MSALIVNARQRVLITAGQHKGLPIVTIEIRRIGNRSDRPRYLNIRANCLGEFIDLLAAAVPETQGGDGQ
jgi:hypothetical protein